MRNLKEILKTTPEFKNGEKVFELVSCKFGFIEITDNYSCPIRFQDVSGCFICNFTTDGKSSNINMSRTLFTIEEAAEMGFVDYPIGENCFFWDDSSRHLATGVLSAVVDRNDFRYLSDKKLCYQHYKPIHEALADKEFCEMFGLRFDASNHPK